VGGNFERKKKEKKQKKEKERKERITIIREGKEK
jgi:hypothetical protein